MTFPDFLRNHHFLPDFLWLYEPCIFQILLSIQAVTYLLKLNNRNIKLRREIVPS